MPDAIFEASGAVRQLWRVEKWPKGIYQILLEGPAGTGKTRGLLEWVHYMCDTYPMIRVLFLRKTKEALAESVLDTWENHVLWRGHPCITGSAGVRNRQSYTFPNGSHIVLGGLKDAQQRDKTLSTQYDIVILFEGRQVTDYDSYQMLARANRNFRIPWQLRIVDTNPGPEFHFLNIHFPKPEVGGCFRSIPEEYRTAPPFVVRCEEGHTSVFPKPEEIELDEEGRIRVPCGVCGRLSPGSTMLRLLSRFQDNPVYWDADRRTWTDAGREYVEGNLAQLSGAPYANLYLGQWQNEEGVIYAEWDPMVHIIDRLPEPPKWYFGAFDKGLRHPGCLQVWGVIGDRMYRVSETYRTEQNIDWWAEQVVRMNQRFGLQAVVCDPSEPEYIAKFNDMLGERRGRDGGRIARGADNARLTGIDMVRWGLSSRDGGPRIFVIRGSHEGLDQKRVAQMKPASLEQEIGSYVWKKVMPDQAIKEEPDPTCDDHACDACRYAAMFLWGRDMTPVTRPRGYDRMSFGAQLEHDEVLTGPKGRWPEDVSPGWM